MYSQVLPSEIGSKSIKCPCLATLKVLVNQGLILPQQWLHSMGIQGDCPLGLGVPQIYYKCYLSSIVHGKPEHHCKTQMRIALHSEKLAVIHWALHNSYHQANMSKTRSAVVNSASINLQGTVGLVFRSDEIQLRHKLL